MKIVSVASTPKLVSVEEFSKLSPPPSGHYELHHGDVVLVTPPLHSHKLLERRLRVLLEDMADVHGFVADTEYAYRPLPESEVWVADVACVSGERDRNAVVTKWLEGSPELTIEIKSPSNDRDQLYDKAMTTLASQCAVEFWIVDPELNEVKVYTKTSGHHIYRLSSEHAVPVSLFDGRVNLDQLFPI